jgi:hypothetical protein
MVMETELELRRSGSKKECIEDGRVKGRSSEMPQKIGSVKTNVPASRQVSKDWSEVSSLAHTGTVV